jgi:hypothetical protein
LGRGGCRGGRTGGEVIPVGGEAVSIAVHGEGADALASERSHVPGVELAERAQHGQGAAGVASTGRGAAQARVRKEGAARMA